MRKPHPRIIHIIISIIIDVVVRVIVINRMEMVTVMVIQEAEAEAAAATQAYMARMGTANIASRVPRTDITATHMAAAAHDVIAQLQIFLVHR